MSPRLPVRRILVLLVVAVIAVFGGHASSSALLQQPVQFQKCPFDGSILTWTGKTQIINGKTWYVMRCVSGHETLSASPS